MNDNSKQHVEKNDSVSELRYGIIEVTTRCQLRCPGCYMVRRDALNHGEMTLKQAIRVLDLCREYRGMELETMDILGGEPLLWPHLKEYINELLRREINPWIFTNMLAITPELATWLYDRGVFITGKLNTGDNTDPDQVLIQSKLMGANAATVEKLFTAIDVFLQAGYKFPLFRLENLLRKDNAPHVSNYVRFCRARNIGVDVEVMACGEGLGNDYFTLAPNPTGLAQVAQVLATEMGKDTNQLLMPHFFSACRFFDGGLYFAHDGSIRACSNSTVQLSHVEKSNPIAEAWNSPLLCQRRRINQQDIGEPCHSCDRFDRCRGGCRATAEGLGDLNAGYLLCPIPLLK